MNLKVVVKVALGLLVVLALAAVVLLVIVGLSIWHTVAHGDEETQMKTAAEVLSCDPSTIKISGMRAEGCGRACLLQTTGSRRFAPPTSEHSSQHSPRRPEPLQRQRLRTHQRGRPARPAHRRAARPLADGASAALRARPGGDANAPRKRSSPEQPWVVD